MSLNTLKQVKTIILCIVQNVETKFPTTLHSAKGAAKDSTSAQTDRLPTVKKNYLCTFFSGGLLISFFLPWVDVFIFTLSGYNIPVHLGKIYQLSTWSGKPDEHLLLVKSLSYLLYLIPIFCVYNIIRDISQYKPSKIRIEFIVGIIAAVYIAWDISSAEKYDIKEIKEFVKYLSLGSYLTVAFSILGFFSSLINTKTSSNNTGTGNPIKQFYPAQTSSKNTGTSGSNTKTSTKDIFILLEAARLGDPVKQYELGEFFELKGNKADAIKWYKAAATQGYEKAIMKLKVLK